MAHFTAGPGGLGVFSSFDRRNARPVAPIAGSPANLPPVPVGWARLTADDNERLSILVELDDAEPRPTQGYGGWEEVPRPKRTSMTVWRGFQAFGIDLDLFIDNFVDGSSIEPVINILEALAGRGRLATGGEPPKVIVDTNGVMAHDAHEDPNNRWVINNLDWDADTAIVNDHGNHVRAAVTVSLLQHVADSRIQDRALATKLKLDAAAGGARKTYVVKSGETLITIARTELHDAGRWTELTALNGIRDPRSVKAGAKIKLP